MNDQDIRKIVQDEMMRNYTSGAPKVPPHIHDGVTNSRIYAKNVVPNNALCGTITVTAGTAQENTLTLGGNSSQGINNPSVITFNGIARTPVAGGATKKASITGTARIGNIGLQLPAPPGGNEPIKNIVQQNSSAVFDVTSGVWVPTVYTDNINLITVFDPSAGQIVGYIQVVEFTNTSVTFAGPLNTGWKIIGSVIIS